MDTSSSAALRALSASPVQTTSMDDLFDSPALIDESATDSSASTTPAKAAAAAVGDHASANTVLTASPASTPPVQSSPATPQRKDGRSTASSAAASQKTKGGAMDGGRENDADQPVSRVDLPPGHGSGFRVGFAEDRNKRCRRTMEDAHSFLYNFDDVQGQGFFAIFDGHAGKQAADWCGEHFHETFSQVLKEANPSDPVPEVIHRAFLEADERLNQQPDGRYSGCTAIVVFLRTESDRGRAVGGDSTPTESDRHLKLKRKLYAGNVGDARAVLCRGKNAIRLSYDHKGSDSQEAKRIMDAGGFVMNDRVNGVLAVTRSLGDFTMKEFIVGAPFTVETEITSEDPFLILACDGLWDVCSDQEAVNLVYDIQDPQKASEKLLAHALEKYSTDNLSVMVVRFHHDEQPPSSAANGLAHASSSSASELAPDS